MKTYSKEFMLGLTLTHHVCKIIIHYISQLQLALKVALTHLKGVAALISSFNPSVWQQSPPPGTKGATSEGQARDLLDQAKKIVKVMRENQTMDFQNDWKLITVFFSAENPCSSCASTQPVPKAFVNLVDSTELATSPRVCQDHDNASNPGRNQCNCVGEHSTVDDNILRWSYQDAWEKLLESERYDQKDDFTVVIQPSLQEINLLLRLGRDGFNTMSKTQVEILEEDYIFMALGLWNNMMEPVGQKKPYDFTKMLQVLCPSQERSYGTSIPCSGRGPSDTVPMSVHNLRPADIQVIAALGDSLTAGNGAGSKPHNVLDVITQYRGISWSVGGNENISTVTTLTNILREFNPSLRGYSTGTGKETTENAAFNQAVAGSRAEDVPAQVRRLVDRMKNDSVKIHFQHTWKLVTLFIGGNDLCGYCRDPIRYSPENYTYNIQIALDMLHREVPRAFVNLVTILSIASLQELYAEKSISCPRLIMRSLCPCVLNYDGNSSEFNTLISFNKKYQERTRQLVESGRYDTREDFTVVLQPFMMNVSMPKTQEGLPDSSYFAPDCFHFSQKSHSQAARALWNNMLEPVGQKTDNQKLENEIVLKCPNEAEPFLRTYKNSNYTYGSQLLCEDRTPSSPSATSVHALKPADVKIIAALGDSLTAGTGIASDNLMDLSTEYRGLSWSIGGDASLENVTTLPNIFREFNAKIVGYSTGTGSVNESDAFLNQAVPGAEAEQLPDQARTLLRLMKTDPRIDFSADWKIITVHIGGNDLCNYCKDPDHYSAINFTRRIQETLDILHEQFGIQRLVESGRYDTRENFTVVVQSFLQNPKIPLHQDGHPDISYFAPDCFHPSQKGHSQLARALWNAMFQPVGQKDDSFDFTANITLSCPTQNIPFLGTYKNSNYTHSPVDPTDEPAENWGSDLSCSEQIPSRPVPTSVHELRPVDIKVIGALGDSLTTAVGAQATDPQRDWRGLSWSIGGDGTLETQTTLPSEYPGKPT
nr:PREDICTED: phospholipase B1, membrane-associated [Struthio camelus australis]